MALQNIHLDSLAWLTFVRAAVDPRVVFSFNGTQMLLELKVL